MWSLIMLKTRPWIPAAALAAVPHAAWAHHVMDGNLPQTFVQGLLSGLGHPLIGLDHAAFIVAAGFLLALVSGGAWGVLALIAGSLLGAALHLGGINLPWGEAGVALSVMLVGALVIARRRIALSWQAGGLALAGLLHGHAYAESIFGAEPTPLIAYLIGFSLVQGAVALAALWAHRQLIVARAAWVRPVSAVLGAAVSTIGALFLASSIAG
jgi:urease accessory protein